MTIDRLENWRSYVLSPRLQKALELLERPEVLNLPDGRHELDGDRIIAMPQGYPTRPRTEGRWEAHRRYIDIQYIISGQETMGWAPVSTLEPVTTFDEAKDVGFFAGNGDMLTVRQGMFALFLPQDAHMPCLRVGQDPEQVRKIVMKVAAD